jgi:ActR/RegA family two-component response regulator
MATWSTWTTPSPSWQVGGRTIDVTLLSEGTPVVFVVNDDVSLRERLEQLISRVGWKAETFESAMEFLARHRNLNPSCLILDVDDDKQHSDGS